MLRKPARLRISLLGILLVLSLGAAPGSPSRPTEGRARTYQGIPMQRLRELDAAVRAVDAGQSGPEVFGAFSQREIDTWLAASSESTVIVVPCSLAVPNDILDVGIQLEPIADYIQRTVATVACEATRPGAEVEPAPRVPANNGCEEAVVTAFGWGIFGPKYGLEQTAVWCWTLVPPSMVLQSAASGVVWIDPLWELVDKIGPVWVNDGRARITVDSEVLLRMCIPNPLKPPLNEVPMCPDNDLVTLHQELFVGGNSMGWSLTA